MKRLVAVAGLVLVLGAGVFVLGSGFGLLDGPELPTDGIVAATGAGKAMTGYDDTLTGKVGLEDGCMTVTPIGGKAVVPVFGAGEAEVDDELTKLTWGGRIYSESQTVTMEGLSVGAFTKLDRYAIYFIPGGCLAHNRLFVVNNS